VDHDIRGFDVTVGQFAVVELLESLQDLPEVVSAAEVVDCVAIWLQEELVFKEVLLRVEH